MDILKIYPFSSEIKLLSVDDFIGDLQSNVFMIRIRLQVNGSIFGSRNANQLLWF